MNRYISAVVLALVALLAACTKPVEEILTLSRTEYTTSADEAKFSLNVTHSGDYTISIEDGASSWLSAVPNGAEKNMIVVTIKKNEDYNERSGRVAVKMGSLTEYISVKQAQRNAIVASQTEYEVECEAGEITVKLGSNVDYKMEIGGRWLSLASTKAYQEQNLVFAYEANMGAEARTATVKFSSNNLQEVVTVTQKGRIREYVLTFVHDNASVTAPLFSGSIISGSILWGDGSDGTYMDGVKHDYVSAKEYTVKMTLQGGLDEQVVTFKDVVGIKEIDLTGM